MAAPWQILAPAVLAGALAAIGGDSGCGGDCSERLDCPFAASANGGSTSASSASSSASSSGGSGGQGGTGGGAPTCPGEAPGCVNDWLAPGMLVAIGGIAGDSAFLYAAANNAIYRIPFGSAPSPQVIAGSPSTADFKDGAGAGARFGQFAGVALDSAKGLLYVVDLGIAGGYGCAIRRVDVGGSIHGVTTVSPSMPSCSSVVSPGPANMAQLAKPFGLALDTANPHEQLYLADTSLVSVSLGDGSVKTLTASLDPPPRGVVFDAGTNSILAADGIGIISVDSMGPQPYCGSAAGNMDGPCASAQFAAPTGLAENGQVLYVSDSGNDNVRAIALKTQTVSSLAGHIGAAHAVGLGTQAGIVAPSWLFVRDGTAAELYIVENATGIRRMVLP